MSKADTEFESTYGEKAAGLAIIVMIVYLIIAQ